MWIAAMSAAGARRAARFNAHFLPQGDRGETLDVWHAEQSRLGHDVSTRRVGIIKGVFVTDDKAAEWPPVRASERYRMQLYQRFFAESDTHFGAGEHIPQTWAVGTVDEVTAELSEFMQTYGITDLVTWGIPPGLNSQVMERSLERFVKEVVPRLRET